MDTTNPTPDAVETTANTEESPTPLPAAATPDMLADRVAVHPLAASFPMLEGDDLTALVDDIRTNGLLLPIVTDPSWQILDGRNRLRACHLAGVEPTFTTTDRDPVAYILSANVNRRHLTKGQTAMAFAMAYPEPTERGGRGKTTVSNTGVSSEYITKARFVLRNAPDLATKVMSGLSLPDAYEQAAKLKREQEEMDRLRAEVRDHLDSIGGLCDQLKANIDKSTTAFVDQDAFVRSVRSVAETIIERATDLRNV